MPERIVPVRLDSSRCHGSCFDASVQLMLSTKPDGDYQTVYPIADVGKNGRAWRDDYHIETVTGDVATDPYSNPIRIIAHVQ
jgi:hypothetical protein